MRIEHLIERFNMKNDFNGQFSLGLKSLQAQLDTILEDAGGAAVSKLLDSLCQLNACEQQLVLSMFSNVVERVLNGEIRVKEDGNALREFEESLYSELLEDINSRTFAPKARLSVIDGGKNNEPEVKSPQVVSLSKLREAKRLGIKPVIN